jgi:hypothetical protein
MKSFTYIGAGLYILGVHLLVGNVIGQGDNQFKLEMQCQGVNSDTCDDWITTRTTCVDSALGTDPNKPWKVCMPGPFDVDSQHQVPEIHTKITVLRPGWFYRAPDGVNWLWENCQSDHWVS